MKKLFFLLLVLSMQNSLFSETHQEAMKRLDDSPIRFERVDFKEVDLKTIFAWISTESKRLDPNKKGFEVRFAREELSDKELKEILEGQTFSLNLKDVPIPDLIRVVSALSHLPFNVNGDEIWFLGTHGPQSFASARKLESEEIKNVLGFSMLGSAQLIKADAYDNMFTGTCHITAKISGSDFQTLMNTQRWNHDRNPLMCLEISI